MTFAAGAPAAGRLIDRRRPAAVLIGYGIAFPVAWWCWSKWGGRGRRCGRRLICHSGPHASIVLGMCGIVVATLIAPRPSG
jgi:hypothetical protein